VFDRCLSTVSVNVKEHWEIFLCVLRQIFLKVVPYKLDFMTSALLFSIFIVI
jgi:hypothetical protein